MTGYSHVCHLIKLIHWGALERDVWSDKMVLRVMTHTFYFMLRLSSLLSTVVSFVYKAKWWFDESTSVTFRMKSTEKEFFYSLSTLALH